MKKGLCIILVTSIIAIIAIICSIKGNTMRSNNYDYVRDIIAGMDYEDAINILHRENAFITEVKYTSIYHCYALITNDHIITFFTTKKNGRRVIQHITYIIRDNIQNNRLTGYDENREVTIEEFMSSLDGD